MPRLVLGAIVVLVGAALVGVVFVQWILNPEADRANLQPAPDSIVWEEGDETTLWLDTNRSSVDMRIDRVSLGIGDIRSVFPESGQVATLGRGEGCLAWAVDGLEISNITGSVGSRIVDVQGTIDRGATTGLVDVHLRTYFESQDIEDAVAFVVDAAANSSSFSLGPLSLGDDGPWIVEASHDSRFPEPYTRVATADLSMDPDDALDLAADDSDAEHVRIRQHGGVGVIACAEDDDIGIGLHGDDRELLNHYVVDVHADPTPVPTATPVSTPSAAQFQDVRVCVDSADARANYLDGWEYVGPALTAADFGLAGSLSTVSMEDTIASNQYVYFFATELTSGNVQIRVTPAGASNTVGLDADRVYPITVTGAGVRRASWNTA